MRPQRAAATAALRALFDNVIQEDTTDDDSIDEDVDEEDGQEEIVSEEDSALDEDEESKKSDSSDDETVAPPGNSGPVKSHNGNEQWERRPFLHQDARRRRLNILRCEPGPTRSVAERSATIEGSFRSFFTDEMCDLIVRHTNAEGRHQLSETWKDICLAELLTYLGLLLLAGVYRGNKEPVSHLWNKKTGRPIFSNAMSRNRFTTITRCLRFDDKDTRVGRREKDKLAPIREFADMFAVKCRSNYRPSAEVTVDEQLVVFHGRCPFKVYVPSKPGKYGIKIWILADVATSYCCNFDVYAGKVGRTAEVGQGARVVMQLAEPIAGSGRNITGDNFFSSLFLSRSLLDRQLSYIGTVRKNKGFLPDEFRSVQNREEKSSVFLYQRDTTIVSYVPKKGRNVILLSTMHHKGEVSLESSDKKPEIILDYNRTKAGVDNLDKLVRTYSAVRKSRRWPMILFMNFLDIAAFNSFVCYLWLHPHYNATKSHRRRLYLEELATALIADAVENRQQTRQENVSAFIAGPISLQTQGQKKRQRCALCPRNKDKKTVLECPTCANPVCRGHVSQKCVSCAGI